MPAFRKSRSFIPWALSLFFIIPAFWMTLAPTQLGGAVTYAIVDGISMENRFHRGDLVLARTEPTYQVGDAVVYWNAEMKSFVFHRIVGLDSTRFILKGDNNAWLDSYHPTQGEIAGKLWVHIPIIGKAIEWARVPIHLSLTVGLLGGVLMFDFIKDPTQRKKNRKTPWKKPVSSPGHALYVFGLTALVFAAASLYSLARPLTHPIGNVIYTQGANYSYSATGTPGVYDRETVQAGEPVFPKLTCFLNIGLTYNLTGANFQNTMGNYQMYARIMDAQSGWQRTIPLNPGTAFNGNSFFTTAALDLCQVESLVTLVEQEAGLKQTAYTLEVVTDVAFTAEADGNQIHDSFSPALVFTYNKVQFYLTAKDSQTDPLRSSQEGSIKNPGEQTNTIPLMGLSLSVWNARLVSLTGFAMAFLGLLYAVVQVYQTASQNSEKLIDLKYGSVLVDIPYQDLSPSSPILDLATIDDLARLAERHGTLILHMSRNSGHTYFVQENGTIYRYVIGETRKDVPTAKPEQQDFSRRTKASVREPAPIPNPIYQRAPINKIQEQPEPVVPLIQDESTQPDAIRPVEQKTENSESVPEALPEYFIDLNRLKRTQSASNKAVEYAIHTGVIEYEPAQPDTVFLRKIKI